MDCMALMERPRVWYHTRATCLLGQGCWGTGVVWIPGLASRGDGLEGVPGCSKDWSSCCWDRATWLRMQRKLGRTKFEQHKT